MQLNNANTENRQKTTNVSAKSDPSRNVKRSRLQNKVEKYHGNSADITAKDKRCHREQSSFTVIPKICDISYTTNKVHACGSILNSMNLNIPSSLLAANSLLRMSILCVVITLSKLNYRDLNTNLFQKSHFSPTFYNLLTDNIIHVYIHTFIQM